jgi:hypothetical protein
MLGYTAIMKTLQIRIKDKHTKVLDLLAWACASSSRNPRAKARGGCQ